MFHNVIADLPTFGENNSNKENLIKELIQENRVDNEVWGIFKNEGDETQPPEKTLNVDGKEKPVDRKVGKKKGCYLLIIYIKFKWIN